MMSASQILLSCLGLLILASLPLLLVWLLAASARVPAEPRAFVIGNSMLLSEEGPVELPLLTPLVHLVRTAEEPVLRNLMLGLRFFPVEQTEPILKRFRSSKDAELQIYSQSVRQEAMESLQATYVQLKAKLSAGSPSLTASYLSSGLRLLDAPFTPDTEHATLLREMATAARAALQQREALPRMLFEAGRVLTRCDSLDEAQTAFHRLPDPSPLRIQGERLLEYRRSIERANEAPFVLPHETSRT